MPQFPIEPTPITKKKQDLIAAYSTLWNELISQWNSPGPDDRAWLLYSANYIFRTAGIRWALDLLTLKQRLPEAPEVDVAHDLEGLSFILLTHQHADHLDLKLVHDLSSLPIVWIVPEFIRSTVEQTGLSRDKIILPRPMESIEIKGMLITPFEGLHLENDSERPDGPRGVPAMGYLVEFGGKRWLFPGDVRTYDVSQLPSFATLDGAFVHLWLGRASARLDEPPLLESFGRFCVGLQSPRLIVTHLFEFGRDETEIWDDDHLRLVKRWMRRHAPGTRVESAITGQSIRL